MTSLDRAIIVCVSMLIIAIIARISYVHYLGKSVIDEATKSESFVDNMAEAEMARSVSKGCVVGAILVFIMDVLPKLI